MQTTLETAPALTREAMAAELALEMLAYDSDPSRYQAELRAMLAPSPRCRRKNRQAFKGQPVQ